MMNINIREILLDALLDKENRELKSHLLIREVLEKYDYLDARDKAFIKRAYEGTIASEITLDYVLNLLSTKEVSKLKPVIRIILRTSAYQILFMDKIPDNAVCDEAVKLCRKRSFENFCPFVNGVLRNLCKKKEELMDFDGIKDRAVRLSVKYSCPEWIVRMFIKEQKDAEGLLEALSLVRPTTVRIIDEKRIPEILSRWDEKHIAYEESRYVKGAFLLTDFEGMENLYGFEEGLLFVQDESSMLASMAAGTKGKALTVMDVCAAPGGKSSFIAASLQDGGKVLSFDVSEQKTSLIEENFERCGFKNTSVRVLDATEFHEEYENTADVCIADVPCSGLGIMARKSDIKYNLSVEAMKDICELQKRIVENVSKYVKPGGVLIYSTCTIHKAENEKMVKYILNNLPFRGDSIKPYAPTLFNVERECDFAVQMLPNVDNTDGFFVARFVKNEE